MAKKIASNAIVKEVSGKANGIQVKFGNFKFTSGQAEKLMDLAQSKEPVKVTIEKVQENLPGTE